ncbi:protein Brevis radix-like 1 [Andrographis paniculata]|uniref:protein Brevis radix-like 1 n=1 Tax=Andrographis paniculata TaxID=175694 RepID=UPI0021E848A9|nr:protein Brevis radix-like 1 [Andrographis paniculata]XP_051129807.1 protein Brevis radix-like 1 [Andrographis paniculata]
MLTCITCSKQRIEDGEDAPRGASNTKDAVKSLTSQIKDIALKVSGSASKSKSDNFKIGQRAYPEFDTISERVPHPYLQGGSSSSTPVWARTPRAGPGPGLESVSAQFGEITIHDEDEPREWMAQVEPGVQITFISLPRGGNDLKRIRFSREMFNKWQAQRWWGENFDRIMELYNVQKFHQQVMNTPGRSEDGGRDSSYSRVGSTLGSPRMAAPAMTPRYSSSQYYCNNPGAGAGVGAGAGPSNYPYHYPYNGYPNRMSSMEASRTTTSSRDETGSVSISNASEVEVEWIEEDQPGVFITIRQFADGTRELRRVRFSREKFGEVDAKQWWEANRDRIQSQYLS